LYTPNNQVINKGKGRYEVCYISNPQERSVHDAFSQFEMSALVHLTLEASVDRPLV